MDGSIHDAALVLLNKMTAAAEAQDVAEASEFIVAVHDPETDGLTFSGGFTDPVTALVYADRWVGDLNRGNGPNDAPFSAKVYPMMRPDEHWTTTER